MSLSELAFSIPHIRNHMKFIWEVQEALGILEIPFEPTINEGDVFSQESYVEFYTQPEHLDFAKALIEYLSPKKRTTEELKAFKDAYEGPRRQA